MGIKPKNTRPAVACVLPPISDQAYCVACGCNEFAACETKSGACGWAVRPVGGGRGLCTACAPFYANPRQVLDAVREALTPTRNVPR